MYKHLGDILLLLWFPTYIYGLYFVMAPNETYKKGM